MSDRNNVIQGFLSMSQEALTDFSELVNLLQTSDAEGRQQTAEAMAEFILGTKENKVEITSICDRTDETRLSMKFCPKCGGMLYYKHRKTLNVLNEWFDETVIVCPRCDEE